MRYKKLVATAHGGPETLKFEEDNLRLPSASEARIRMEAAPLCQDDVAVRVGNRPVLAKIPFVPGYAFIGRVEAVGESVRQVKIGERVAALTNYGSHAEVIYWNAEELVKVPEALDAAEAATLILNYLVAWQILHRVVQVKEGESALIVGASGGVGTAFLQLGKLAGLRMYGLASPSKHTILEKYGAVPVDYHRLDLVEALHQLAPDGLDYVFNGMDESYFEPGLAMLRRGGVLVHYGAPLSFKRLLWLVAKLVYYNLLPNGKTIKGYGTHRESVNLFKADWEALFGLLAAREIEPVIAQRFPFEEAVRANEMLESGQVTGNIVIMGSG